MPKISNKGQLMPESPIRKLIPYSEEAIKKGKKVYHLNIGQPDIKTPEIALEAIKNTDISTLAYSRSEGSESYRHKISNYYKTHNIDVNQDDIIVTTGGSEALLFAFGSIMDHDDEIIIPEPFYANYNGFSTASNVNIVPVISNIDNNFALPPIENFEELITEKTKAIIAVSLYGQTADMARINRIASDNGNIPVIEDAAQSFGATYYKKKSCSLGDVSCTSFFPSKPCCN